MKQLRVGAINNLEDAKIAIRDLENSLQEVLALFTAIDTPSGTKVLVMTADGNLDLYELISSGGSTINVDDAAKELDIQVP